MAADTEFGPGIDSSAVSIRSVIMLGQQQQARKFVVQPVLTATYAMHLMQPEAFPQLPDVAGIRS